MRNPPAPGRSTSLRCVKDERGNSITLNASAFAENLAATREAIGDATQVFQVVKGDGYGLGLSAAVRIGLDAGVDGFCVGTPAEARRLQRLAPEVMTLLFTASHATTLPAVAAGGTIVSVHSINAFQALVRSRAPARFFLELDCGFGRYGLDTGQLATILSAYPAQDHAVCVGAYTHFGMAAHSILTAGLARFDRYIDAIHEAVPGPLITMVASTDTILDRPRLPYSAVDPGRLLYGLLTPELRQLGAWSPVLVEIASTLTQVTRVPRGQRLKIGYENEIALPAGGQTGVFPLGWLDGLSNHAPFGSVLVGGRPVPVVARTLLHSIVDLSEVPEATLGDAVVLVGDQGDSRLDLDDVAAVQGMTTLQLHMAVPGAIARGADAELQS